MPENTEGRTVTPPCAHTEQPFNDVAVALARLENGQAVLGAAIAQLAAQLSALSERISDAEAEAEDILRRAGSSPVSSPQRPRGRTVLRLVQVVVIAVLILGVALSAPGGARVHRAVHVLPSRGRSWSVYHTPGRVLRTL